MSAVDVLREYASALRGAWGDIDGRSEKIALNAIADAIESDDPPTDGWLREQAGVCPWGRGHWTDYCRDYRCGEASP